MVRLFRKHITPELSAGLGGGLTRDNSKGPGTALYVDTENLQGSAQTLIENIIEDWPEGNPAADTPQPLCTGRPSLALGHMGQRPVSPVDYNG